MNKSCFLVICLLSLSSVVAVPTLADMRKWVAIEDLKRYTCPSTKCGVVGRFFFGESLLVFETRDGWSRVTHYKSAACFDGKSIFVEAGPDTCSQENGIVQGEFAEWVQSEFLAQERLESPLEVQG